MNHRGKMSLNNGQSLNVGGQDFTKNGDNSSRAPWEDARTVLRPSTPTRKPKSVSIYTAFCLQYPFTLTEQVLLIIQRKRRFSLHIIQVKIKA